MERREMLGAIGALAAASVAVRAAAADHDHHHHHGGGKYQALVASASDCLVKGETCLAHCLVLLGDGDKQMAACAQSVNQMLALCDALQRLGAQNSAHAAALSKVALDVCVECEKECRKHEKKHAECKACADACAECVKQCKATV